MGNFSELSSLKQWEILVLGGVLLTGALYFTVFNSQQTANQTAQKQLDDKLRENAELESERRRPVLKLRRGEIDRNRGESRPHTGNRDDAC